MINLMYNFLQITLFWQDYLQLFNIENYLKYSKCIKIKILAFDIYIYSVTQNGSSPFTPPNSPGGQLLLHLPVVPTACLPSPSSSHSLQREGRSWKEPAERPQA